MGVNAFEPHAITKPVTEAELGRLLQEWGVEVDRWESWLDSDLWTWRPERRAYRGPGLTQTRLPM